MEMVFLLSRDLNIKFQSGEVKCNLIKLILKRELLESKQGLVIVNQQSEIFCLKKIFNQFLK